MMGQKYDHRAKNRKYYYPLALFMGCGEVERHLEMAKPSQQKKTSQFASNAAVSQSFNESLLPLTKSFSLLLKSNLNLRKS